MKTRYLVTLLLIPLTIISSYGQENQSADTLKMFFQNALQHETAYRWLQELCEKGHRLSGSPSSYKAVDWAVATLKEAGLDKVWTQEFDVPHWVRGEERAVILQNGRELNVTALGGSVGTLGWVPGEVVEIMNWDELDALGENLKGKVVFYNRPMDPTFMETGMGYGTAVDQRWAGAMRAGAYGAVGVIVRSVTTRHDDFPHTGSMGYVDTIPKIPALGISTNDADELSAMLSTGDKLDVKMFLSCHQRPDTVGYNVIGEITGSQFPDEIIVVGGHLDSWDLGTGAQDDGAGCVQSMEVLKQFIDLGIRPKRTIRVVLFANEENGLRGARHYAAVAKEKEEFHMLGIESDGGGYSPQGFRIQGSDEAVAYIRSYRELFAPFGMFKFVKSGSGADVGRLKTDRNIMLGLHVDGSRYFDVHHTSQDNIDHVNPRELELGTAAMSAMIFLIDRNGIPALGLDAE
jgi:hypothetical protein